MYRVLPVVRIDRDVPGLVVISSESSPTLVMKPVSRSAADMAGAAPAQIRIASTTCRAPRRDSTLMTMVLRWRSQHNRRRGVNAAQTSRLNVRAQWMLLLIRLFQHAAIHSYSDSPL